MVGIGNVLGVLTSDAVIDYCHSERAYYPAAMLCIALLGAAMWWWLRRPGEPGMPLPQVAETASAAR
jgi:hypothetical protein